MKIYLASPFFNKSEINIYNLVISKLRAMGHEVYVPREHEVDNAWELPNNVWGNAVYTLDEKAIKDCECVVVLNFGMYSDSGTAWEAGFAQALNKKIVQVLCGDENTVYSLMMINPHVTCCTYRALELDYSNVDFSKIIIK